MPFNATTGLPELASDPRDYGHPTNLDTAAFYALFEGLRADAEAMTGRKLTIAGAADTYTEVFDMTGLTNGFVEVTITAAKATDATLPKWWVIRVAAAAVDGAVTAKDNSGETGDTDLFRVATGVLEMKRATAFNANVTVRTLATPVADPE